MSRSRSCPKSRRNLTDVPPPRPLPLEACGCLKFADAERHIIVPGGALRPRTPCQSSSSSSVIDSSSASKST
jgi:hypothetical protein